MSAFLTIAFFVLRLQSAALPQTVQPGGTVEGIVVKLGSAEPLPDTRVALVKADGTTGSYVARAEGNGSFRFADVAPGAYRLLATRDDGFLPAEYGQTEPNRRGLPITLSSRQAFKAQLTMAPPAAVSGRIFDQGGQPLGHAQVQALKTFYRNGRRELTIVQSVQTNDLGEYRLFWLAPGPYYLSARQEDLASKTIQAYIRPPEDQTIHTQTAGPVVSRRILENGDVVEEIQAPVYFPGTTEMQRATPINLRAGDDIRGIDINLLNLPPARRIRGVVIDGTTGQPLGGALLRAIPKNSGPDVTIPNTVADGKGAFEMTGVAPGLYYLFANPGRAGGYAGGSAGRASIEVAAKDLDNISIIVPAGFNIPGRFVIDGKTDLDLSAWRISIRREPDVPGMPSPQLPVRVGTPEPNATNADGSFVLSGVGAGDYRVGIYSLDSPRPIVRLPDTVFLKSVRLGNLDLLMNTLRLDEQPVGQIEVVLGTNVGAVAGTVMNDAREPIPNIIVSVLPESALRSRTDLYMSAATDSSGNFELKGIGPGDYKLFAWDDVENGAWLDPEFLQPFESRGTAIHVNSGITTSTQLTIISSRR